MPAREMFSSFTPKAFIAKPFRQKRLHTDFSSFSFLPIRCGRRLIPSRRFKTFFATFKIIHRPIGLYGAAERLRRPRWS